MSSITPTDLGYSGEGYYKLELKLVAAEFEKLTRLAERHGLGRAELLQHLLKLADDATTAHDRPAPDTDKS